MGSCCSKKVKVLPELLAVVYQRNPLIKIKNYDANKNNVASYNSYKVELKDPIEVFSKTGTFGNLEYRITGCSLQGFNPRDNQALVCSYDNFLFTKKQASRGEVLVGCL